MQCTLITSTLFFVSDYAIQIICNQLLPSSMLRTVNNLNVVFCKKLLPIFIKKILSSCQIKAVNLLLKMHLFVVVIGCYSAQSYMQRPIRGAAGQTGRGFV